jgi:hypothetical protein
MRTHTHHRPIDCEETMGRGDIVHTKKERGKNVLCPADEEKCPPSFSFPAIQSANIGLYII